MFKEGDIVRVKEVGDNHSKLTPPAISFLNKTMRIEDINGIWFHLEGCPYSWIKSELELVKNISINENETLACFR